MRDFIIWDAASLAWTEIGLDDEGYREYAVKIAKDFETWDEIDKIILQDVCASFATNSATMIFAIIPLLGMLLVTPMPDWGYEEDYLSIITISQDTHHLCLYVDVPVYFGCQL
ncbi:hypothetical protein [Aliikangiella sp. IMCC44359]|uniref:hypothetical protein n=1 Tax=Aliikangiella sp. IMCC44359 TaxID=3459125 RepID=UPI00403A9F02